MRHALETMSADLVAHRVAWVQVPAASANNFPVVRVGVGAFVKK